MNEGEKNQSLLRFTCSPIKPVEMRCLLFIRFFQYGEDEFIQNEQRVEK